MAPYSPQNRTLVLGKLTEPGVLRNNNTLDQRQDIWLGSLAAEIEAAKQLELVAEAGIATNTDKGSDIYPIFLKLDLIYSLTDRWICLSACSSG